MKKVLNLFLISALLVSFSSAGYSQSLEQTLSNLSSTAGKAYVSPIISAFGSNLNSGWVSKLPEATMLKLHLDLKIIVAGSFFNDDEKSFATSGKFYFDDTQASQILAASGYTSTSQGYNELKQALTSKEFDVNFTGPTVIGSENEHLKITFPKQDVSAGGQTYTVNAYTLAIDEVKGLLNNLSVFPTPGVQLSAGTVLGTNVSLRYSPKIKINDEVGDFDLLGFGFVNNPGTFLMVPLPLDFGISYFTQKMKVGTVFESTASQFGIYVGKTFGSGVAFSPYAGYIMESSNTKVSYNYQSNQEVNGVPVPETKIKFEIDGQNKSGLVLGFNLKLGIVNLNADYKAAKTKTASAGLSFGF